MFFDRTIDRACFLNNKKMHRTKTKDILLIIFSVCITVLSAEFVVRSFGVRPYETRLERYEFDDTLGWVTRKSQATYISKRRYAHQLFYDKDGFPSDRAAINDSNSSTQPSIALIGDSFVEGYYLPYEQTLANRLSQLTGKQILNLGVSGYSPGQYLLSARRHLARYNVTDIVVFLFAFNDIPYVSLDMYRGYEKPLVSDESYEAVNLPLEKIAGNEAQMRGPVKSLLDKFALWSLIKPLFVFLGQDDAVELVAERLDASEMNRSLKLIARINTEYPGASFHVYYIPDITELNASDVYAFNISSFEQHCARLGLNCITPDFPGGQDVDTLYIPEDHHLSSLGAEFVAKQISALLADP